jgi:hypothetical protein
MIDVGVLETKLLVDNAFYVTEKQQWLSRLANAAERVEQYSLVLREL